MNLKEYLINCFYEEQDIIEELLYIDNSIQHTAYTYEQLLTDIKNIDDNEKTQINGARIAITDGEFTSVVKVLVNIPNLETIWIDRTSLGINKYLVSRTNEFYKEEKINLDITKNYFKYKTSKYQIVISGFDTFVEELSSYFEKAIVIE